MKSGFPQRAHAGLVSVSVMEALVASVIGVGTLSCTGWGVEENSVLLLSARLCGYLGGAWGGVFLTLRRSYLGASIALVVTGSCYLWLETGWLFQQPASSQPSAFALIPFLGALVLGLGSPSERSATA
jgi:hypothetical protein